MYSSSEFIKSPESDQWSLQPNSAWEVPHVPTKEKLNLLARLADDKHSVSSLIILAGDKYCLKILRALESTLCCAHWAYRRYSSLLYQDRHTCQTWTTLDNDWISQSPFKSYWHGGWRVCANFYFYCHGKKTLFAWTVMQTHCIVPLMTEWFSSALLHF